MGVESLVMNRAMANFPFKVLFLAGRVLFLLDDDESNLETADGIMSVGWDWERSWASPNFSWGSVVVVVVEVKEDLERK